MYLGGPVLVFVLDILNLFNDSVILGTLILLISYLLLYVFGGLDDVLNFAYVLCFSEIVMFSYRLFYCMKYKLFAR